VKVYYVIYSGKKFCFYIYDNIKYWKFVIFRVTPKLDIFLLIFSLIVGLYGAIASSYSSFSDLINPKTYGKPCWLDLTAADPPAENKTLF